MSAHTCEVVLVSFHTHEVVLVPFVLCAACIQGLGGEPDFYYGMYVHEAAAQQLMNDKWGGRCPEKVLADKAFYREAVGLAPQMGMTLLAVASRPLPLQQLTT